jgi:hypothetical protein
MVSREQHKSIGEIAESDLSPVPYPSQMMGFSAVALNSADLSKISRFSVLSN